MLIYILPYESSFRVSGVHGLNHGSAHITYIITRGEGKKIRETSVNGIRKAWDLRFKNQALKKTLEGGCNRQGIGPDDVPNPINAVQAHADRKAQEE